MHMPANLSLPNFILSTVYFPFTIHPESRKEAPKGESDTHLTGFFLFTSILFIIFAYFCGRFCDNRIKKLPNSCQKAMGYFKFLFSI